MHLVSVGIAISLYSLLAYKSIRDCFLTLRPGNADLIVIFGLIIIIVIAINGMFITT